MPTRWPSFGWPHPTTPHPPRTHPAPTPHHQHHLASEARERFEATYQNAKAQLLQLGAGGHSQIHTVYDWLARLSDLRRAVEQADKAVQRLAALPDLATTPDEPAPSA